MYNYLFVSCSFIKLDALQSLSHFYTLRAIPGIHLNPAKYLLDGQMDG